MAKYHALKLKVEQFEEYADIDVWVRLRIKGFKYSLMNVLTSWGLLFKHYLRDRVTNSLLELEQFCAEASAVMQLELDKDDLPTLLQMMAILNRIEERSLETDQMFDPLKDIVVMLKEYKFEFDERVERQFADLPDVWNKVKKTALNIKQTIAPTQAYQKDLIAKRVLLFESRAKQFRAHFRSRSVRFHNTHIPCGILRLTAFRFTVFRHPMPGRVRDARSHRRRSDRIGVDVREPGHVHQPV